MWPGPWCLPSDTHLVLNLLTASLASPSTTQPAWHPPISTAKKPSSAPAHHQAKRWHSWPELCGKQDGHIHASQGVYILALTRKIDLHEGTDMARYEQCCRCYRSSRIITLKTDANILGFIFIFILHVIWDFPWQSFCWWYWGLSPVSSHWVISPYPFLKFFKFWAWSCEVAQAGFELWVPPALVSPAWIIGMCHHPRLCFVFNKQHDKRQRERSWRLKEIKLQTSSQWNYRFFF